MRRAGPLSLTQPAGVGCAVTRRGVFFATLNRRTRRRPIAATARPRPRGRSTGRTPQQGHGCATPRAVPETRPQALQRPRRPPLGRANPFPRNAAWAATATAPVAVLKPTKTRQHLKADFVNSVRVLHAAT